MTDISCIHIYSHENQSSRNLMLPSTHKRSIRLIFSLFCTPQALLKKLFGQCRDCRVARHDEKHDLMMTVISPSSRLKRLAIGQYNNWLWEWVGLESRLLLGNLVQLHKINWERKGERLGRVWHHSARVGSLCLRPQLGAAFIRWVGRRMNTGGIYNVIYWRRHI